MRYPIPAIAAGFAALLALNACEQVEAAKDWSYDRGADARDAICSQSLALRVEGVNQVNSRPGNGYWTATDCDKDGQPDFGIDPATGMAVPQ